jgi:hypothetical protein
MRQLIAALPLLALTACGGASGPETVGSSAPPTGGGTSTGGSGGNGGGTSTGGGTTTPTPSPTPGQFLDVSTETTFQAVGALQSLGVTESGVYNQTGPLLYAGNASTVRTPSGTVTYNPRDGIFTVTLADTKAGVNANLRFQDPAHRRDTVQWGVPDLADFNYLAVLGPTHRGPNEEPGDRGREDRITFFYQRPGKETNFVSLAGYVRNAYEPTDDQLVFKAKSESQFERGAMVFGSPTLRSQIPITGTATYTGGLLASMVVNTTATAGNSNYFQWITNGADGFTRVLLDFANSKMDITLKGIVSAANYAGQELPANVTGVPGGSVFNATGTGKIDLTQSGGFVGQFTSVSFTNTTNGAIVPIYDRVNPNNSVAGANSIDGTFYGPNAVNVGGNFRIVGGVPGQRVDILGAFTGAKK